jgi:hypothetical protein
MTALCQEILNLEGETETLALGLVTVGPNGTTALSPGL